MGSRGGVVQDGTVDVGKAPLRMVRDRTVPAAVDRADGRDSFRAAVAALDPGPVRELLTAVAYARDEAARNGSGTASTGRWAAVVAAAERTVTAADADLPQRRAAVLPASRRAVA
jgi:hypothetical protein